VAFVHMGSPDDGEAALADAGIAGMPHVSDPERRLYRAFGLERGRAGQMIGAGVWLRGWRAWRQHGVGWPVNDVRQMPGVFLVHRGAVRQAFRHETSADRVDLALMARGEVRRVS
jgi:hypothetical protein